MADAAAPVQTKSPAKRKTGKPKTPPSHPTYKEMITKAIASLKERKGSSRQAILKYIMANFKVGTDANKVNGRLKLALRSGTKTGAFKQSKGTGAAGSFCVEKKAAAAPKKTKTKKPKSPKKPKKPTAAKKPAAKKPAAKKPAAKKPAAKKPAAKKPAAKKPAAKKPAAKKPAAKKPAAKKPAAKKATKKPAKK